MLGWVREVFLLLPISGVQSVHRFKPATIYIKKSSRGLPDYSQGETSTESLTHNSFPIFYKCVLTPFNGEKKPASFVSGGFEKCGWEVRAAYFCQVRFL